MSEYLDMESKTLLITGDNKDLILQIAEEFALEDAKIALSSIEDDFQKIAEYLREEFKLPRPIEDVDL